MFRYVFGGLMVFAMASVESAGHKAGHTPGGGGGATTLGDLNCTADQIAKFKGGSGVWEGIERPPEAPEVPLEIGPVRKTPGTETGFEAPGTGTGFKTPGTETGFEAPGTGTGFKTPGTGTGFKTPGTGSGSRFKRAK